tara:strand:+ start:6072 stop:9488 length:3417 start_codon:yes stop_codon:yes gene_type:complete
MDHPELAGKFQDILTSMRQEESAKFQADAYAGESPPIDKAAAQQAAAELLLKLSDAQSKWAKSQQNPNKYGLLEAYLGFMGTMSGIEERGQTDITGKKVTGDYGLLTERAGQLRAIEEQRNRPLTASDRTQLTKAASAYAMGENRNFYRIFNEVVALGPEEQQASLMSYLAQQMGTTSQGVLDAANEASMGESAIATTESAIGMEGLARNEQNLLDREKGLLAEFNAVNQRVQSKGGGLGSRGRASFDSVNSMMKTIMEGGDPDQIAELMGLGAQGVPENATHGDIRRIANDMVDFTDEGFQRVLATTHKRDLLYGDSEASRQFREVAERRGYGDLLDSDPEAAYRHLANEYMAEVGDAGINADVNFAYNVLRGGQAASLGDRIKAAAIMARYPGLYADVRRAREGGSEAEARENTARTVEQQQAGESPQEAAQDESQRPEGEPVADENRLAEMRNQTAGRLAGEETGEAAEAPAEAGPSQAVRESLQRSADAHGNAISIPGVEGGMIIPGGGGKIHVPGPDGELIPYTPPVAGRQQATEEDLRIAHEKNFGPAATLPEGAVSKSSEGWADYHLYADGTIRFIHPETGEMVTVSETSDPESYSAIKQKAFGEAPTAPAGVDPIDLPATVDFDDGDFEAPVVKATPGDPAMDPDSEGGPGGLGDDLFATLGEAPPEEDAAPAEAAPATLYDRALAIYEARQRGEAPPEESESAMARRLGVYGQRASQRPGQLTEDSKATSGAITSGNRGFAQPGNVGYVPSDREKELLKVEQLARHMEEGTPSFLGFGGKTGEQIREEALAEYGTLSAAPAEAAPIVEEEEFKQTPYPEGMEDLPQSDYPEAVESAYPEGMEESPPVTETKEVVKSTPATKNAALQASIPEELPATAFMEPWDIQGGDVNKGQRGVTQPEADAANPTPEDLARRDEMHAEHGEFKGSQQRPLGEEDLGETPPSEETSGTAETTASAQRPEELDYPRNTLAPQASRAGGPDESLSYEPRQSTEEHYPTSDREDVLAPQTQTPGRPDATESEKETPDLRQSTEDHYPTSLTGSAFAPGMEGYMEDPPDRAAPGMTASESQATGIPTPPKPPVSPAAKAASPSNLSGGASTEEKATSPVGRYNKAIMESDSMKLAKKMQPAP